MGGLGLDHRSGAGCGPQLVLMRNRSLHLGVGMAVDGDRSHHRGLSCGIAHINQSRSAVGVLRTGTVDERLIIRRNRRTFIRFRTARAVQAAAGCQGGRSPA